MICYGRSCHIVVRLIADRWSVKYTAPLPLGVLVLPTYYILRGLNYSLLTN